MPSILLFLISCALSTWSLDAKAFPLIAAGYEHTCVSDGTSGHAPFCWGDGSHGQTPAPSISSVRMLAAGAWHTCAVYGAEGQGKLACWGSQLFGQSTPPTPDEMLGEPIALSAGDWHNCALFDRQRQRKILCWGGNDSGQTEVPPDLVQPSGVFAGLDFSCALHAQSLQEPAGRVRCWGKLKGEWTATAFPDLKGGSGLTCTKGTGGTAPQCWTNQALRPWTTDLRVTLLNRHLACTLSAPQVACNSSTGPSQAYAAGKRPYDLAVSLWQACALTADGPACWKAGSAEALPVPASGQYLRSEFYLDTLRDLPPTMELLAAYLYGPDAEFLTTAAAALATADDQSLALAAAAFRPFFADLPYRGVRDKYLAKMAPSIDRLVASPAAATAASIRGTALRLLAAGLTTARPWLQAQSGGGLDQFAATERLVGEIGQALFDEKQPTAALKDELRGLIAALSLNSYLTSRAATLMILTEAL